MKSFLIFITFFLPTILFAQSGTFIKGVALIQTPTTTATAAGTTTLTVSSNTNEEFTGVTTQTVVLPNTTTLQKGRAFYIMNRSTGIVTVNYNGGSLAKSLPANTEAQFVVINNATAAGTWDVSNQSSFLAIGTYDSQSGVANGGVISGNSLYFQSATGSVPGMLSTGTQTVAGAKTFSNGVTATVTGTASGNTTYTANNHGVVVSGSTNAMTVLAPDSSTAKAFVSGGSSADPSWATLGVAGGGSGITSGTSGGVLAFTGTTTVASSGLLAQNGVLLGGGAGVAPSSLSTDSSTTKALVSGGTNTAPSWATLSVGGGGTGLTAGTSGGVPYYSSTSAITSSGLLATQGVMLGGGSGGSPTTLTTDSSTAKALVSGGTNTAPSWATLGVGGGGTGLTAGTSGGVPYYSSTSAITSSGLLATKGVMLGGGSGATPTTLATDSSTSKVLISGGTNTAPTWGTVAIAGGGTGAVSQSAGFDALSPMTTGGDIIYGGASGTGTRLANGTAAQVLTSNGTTVAPSWQDAPGAHTWYVNANVSGANPALGLASITTYTEIIDAGLTMTPVSGSQNVGVMCSLTNAATAPSSGATTCAAGSESIGANFAIPATGIYEACFDFTHTCSVDSGVTCFVTYEVVETATNAQTILQYGGTRIQSGTIGETIATGASAGSRFANHICGILNFASTGTKGIRLFETANITGTPGQNAMLLDAASGANGLRDLHITVKQWP